MNSEKSVRNMVMTAVMTAIIIIMAFVPFLGYIPLGFMNATIIHIPVIIGAIILGPKSGGFLGLVFGLTSLWKNTFMPNLTSFCIFPVYQDRRFRREYMEPCDLPGAPDSHRNRGVLCLPADYADV